MCTWVLVKPMFYGLAFSWRKIEKHKRFPWIMRWIMLLEWHLKENSMVSTSATQFIWRLCFPYVYVSPCEAHVLWLGMFLEEDRETQKISLSCALNYAPGATSDGKFYGKYLRYSVYPTPKFSICLREFLWTPCFTARHFLDEDRETQKIPMNYALNYAPKAGSDRKFQGKYLR